jgi:transcriptional regulator of acetoin/glycerol metabolism
MTLRGREAIIAALCDGSAALATRQLGISTATIYRKIKLFTLA